MSISKEYWENPDNTAQNGYVYICNKCDKHGHNQAWSDQHVCDPEGLAEVNRWEKYYTQLESEFELLKEVESNEFQ